MNSSNSSVGFPLGNLVTADVSMVYYGICTWFYVPDSVALLVRLLFVRTPILKYEVHKSGLPGLLI